MLIYKMKMLNFNLTTLDLTKDLLLWPEVWLLCKNNLELLLMKEINFLLILPPLKKKMMLLEEMLITLEIKLIKLLEELIDLNLLTKT